MKLKYIIAAACVALGLSVTSCEYDNYEEPSYMFSGQLKCDGESFSYDASAALFRVFQRGYGKVDGGGTGIRIDEEGRYQQLLFNSEYKLTLVNKALPFELPEFESLGAGKGYDSITYNISSNVQQDFEIRPYYKLKNLKAELKNNNIVATFNIEKMTNTTKSAPKIVKTRIYVSTASLVNSGIKCNRANEVKYLDENTLETSIPVADYYEKENFTDNYRTYAFLRVAIELEGMSEYFLFSPILKIEGLPGK